MSFVLSQPEIEARLERLARPVFADGRIVSVRFETTSAFVAAVLPPGLEPEGSAVASAWVGAWNASPSVGPFAGGGVNVRARHGDLVGNYCLTMPMSTDTAIIFGRDLYGEPKKLATIAVTRSEHEAVGTVQRWGERIIDLRAELAADAPPGEAEEITFHYGVRFAPDGSGLDDDPRLIAVRTRGVQRLVLRGRGQLRLASTPHDPLGDVPVVRVLGAAYTEGDTYTSGSVISRVPADAFLPYALARLDNPLALSPRVGATA